MERKGLSVFCLRQADVEIAGSVIRPLSVFAHVSLSFYQLASHPHRTLLTGYTANGHPYRFYNSIYVNTHLSNDWSGFELNPFPLSSVLPRTPSRFWPSFSASHPPLVRYYLTGTGEWERGRRERERERERQKRQKEEGAGESWGRMYLASLHWLRAFGQHLALHRRANPRKNPTERALAVPIATCLNFLL